MEESEQSRVLVTGAAGMLGSQVLLSVPDGIDVVGTDMREAAGVEAVGVDLTDRDQVHNLFSERGPFTGVIHTAAYTAVDKAEEEQELAMRINRDASELLAECCREAKIPMVMVSTDFVFDGTQGTPYGEEDATNPLSVYGSTKLAGEQAAQRAHPGGVRIARTQWLYGPRGKHFPGTMLQLAQERSELRVVSDQVGSPTSTLELAPALWDVLRLGEAGIYNAACEGEASWYDFALATFEEADVEITVEPCTTSEFPRPAVRPANSVLDCSKLTSKRGKPLADWRDALATFMGSGLA